MMNGALSGWEAQDQLEPHPYDGSIPEATLFGRENTPIRPLSDKLEGTGHTIGRDSFRSLEGLFFLIRNEASAYAFRWLENCRNLHASVFAQNAILSLCIKQASVG